MAWVWTWTGKQFHPLDPDPTTIDLRDIAHALSLLCRFNGHCRTFYSVAEHSVRVSHILPPDLALAGLLHDAAEAYVSDLPRPIKQAIPEFSRHEDRLLGVILQHFGLPPTLPDPVHRADDALLATELRDLMGQPPAPIHGTAPLPDPITPVGPEAAKRAFLDRFEELAPHWQPG